MRLLHDSVTRFEKIQATFKHIPDQIKQQLIQGMKGMIYYSEFLASLSEILKKNKANFEKLLETHIEGELSHTQLEKSIGKV